MPKIRVLVKGELSHVGGLFVRVRAKGELTHTRE